MQDNVPEQWVMEQMIKERAYFLWQEAGCPNESLYFWLQAEEDIWGQYGGKPNEG